MMVNKGNHAQMAELFRSVNYSNLPRWNVSWMIFLILVSPNVPKVFCMPFRQATSCRGKRYRRSSRLSHPRRRHPSMKNIPWVAATEQELSCGSPNELSPLPYLVRWYSEDQQLAFLCRRWTSYVAFFCRWFQLVIVWTSQGEVGKLDMQ